MGDLPAKLPYKLVCSMTIPPFFAPSSYRNVPLLSKRAIEELEGTLYESHFGCADGVLNLEVFDDWDYTFASIRREVGQD